MKIKLLLVIFTPVIHRFLYHFHLELDADSPKKEMSSNDQTGSYTSWRNWNFLQDSIQQSYLTYAVAGSIHSEFHSPTGATCAAFIACRPKDCPYHPGLKDLALTTNGVLLPSYAEDLRKADWTPTEFVKRRQPAVRNVPDRRLGLRICDMIKYLFYYLEVDESKPGHNSV